MQLSHVIRCQTVPVVESYICLLHFHGVIMCSPLYALCLLVNNMNLKVIKQDPHTLKHNFKSNMMAV